MIDGQRVAFIVEGQAIGFTVVTGFKAFGPFPPVGSSDTVATAGPSAIVATGIVTVQVPIVTFFISWLPFAQVVPEDAIATARLATEPVAAVAVIEVAVIAFFIAFWELV